MVTLKSQDVLQGNLWELLKNTHKQVKLCYSAPKSQLGWLKRRAHQHYCRQ